MRRTEKASERKKRRNNEENKKVKELKKNWKIERKK
jgi:hypothetical protein